MKLYTSIQNFGISKIFFEDLEQWLLEINAYNFKLYANKIKLFKLPNHFFFLLYVSLIPDPDTI